MLAKKELYTFIEIELSHKNGKEEKNVLSH